MHVLCCAVHVSQCCVVGYRQVLCYTSCACLCRVVYALREAGGRQIDTVTGSQDCAVLYMLYCTCCAVSYMLYCTVHAVLYMLCCTCCAVHAVLCCTCCAVLYNTGCAVPYRLCCTIKQHDRWCAPSQVTSKPMHGLLCHARDALVCLVSIAVETAEHAGSTFSPQKCVQDAASSGSSRTGCGSGRAA